MIVPQGYPLVVIRRDVGSRVVGVRWVIGWYCNGSEQIVSAVTPQGRIPLAELASDWRIEVPGAD